MLLEHSEAQRVGLAFRKIKAVMVSNGEISRQSRFFHQSCKAGVKGVGGNFGIAQGIGISIVATENHKLGTIFGGSLQSLLQTFVTVAVIISIQMHIRQISECQFGGRLLGLLLPVSLITGSQV